MLIAKKLTRISIREFQDEKFTNLLRTLSRTFILSHFEWRPLAKVEKGREEEEKTECVRRDDMM